MSRASKVSGPFAVILAVLLLSSGIASAAARPPIQVSGVLNLNTATEDELRQLPGVGEKKAARIIAQRSHHKFDSPDQLMKVKGFGRISYRKLKPYLAVSGPTTLHRQTAAPATTPTP